MSVQTFFVKNLFADLLANRIVKIVVSQVRFQIIYEELLDNQGVRLEAGK